MISEYFPKNVEYCRRQFVGHKIWSCHMIWGKGWMVSAIYAHASLPPLHPPPSTALSLFLECLTSSHPLPLAKRCFLVDAWRKPDVEGPDFLDGMLRRIVADGGVDEGRRPVRPAPVPFVDVTEDVEFRPRDYRTCINYSIQFSQ